MGGRCHRGGEKGSYFFLFLSWGFVVVLLVLSLPGTAVFLSFAKSLESFVDMLSPPSDIVSRLAKNTRHFHIRWLYFTYKLEAACRLKQN